VEACPHAAIRPFVVSKEEIAAAPFPKHFDAVKAIGNEFHGKKYAIRVSPLDCTGCNACVETCPENPKALKMVDGSKDMDANKTNWDYAYDLPDRGDLTTKLTVRGSQFQTPLMEFSGACSVSNLLSFLSSRYLLARLRIILSTYFENCLSLLFAAASVVLLFSGMRRNTLLQAADSTLR
jgi:NAD-dependent dihydropyrimidine dehydrogenase PreA subunit